MTDERIQQTIGVLLRAGVVISAVLVGSGAVWYLAVHGGDPVNVRPAAPMERGGPHLLMLAGLVVLIATPVTRVAFSLAAFLLERDYVYVAISSFVLLVLLASIGSSWW
jgi:uncharacterized membrane protein